MAPSSSLRMDCKKQNKTKEWTAVNVATAGLIALVLLPHTPQKWLSKVCAITTEAVFRKSVIEYTESMHSLKSSFHLQNEINQNACF